MKRLITILLTLTMCVCLVNLNNNHTKAEDEEPQQNQKVQAAVAAPVTQPVNAETSFPISTLEELAAFFNNDVTEKIGVLQNDLVITGLPGSDPYTTISFPVKADKTLDLNGNNLIIKRTMLLEAPSSGSNEYSIRIVNSNNSVDSVIKPASGANIKALIATKSEIGDRDFNLNIGDKENGYSGKIVFDGNNKAIAGLGVGLNWLGLLIAAPGARDNVVVTNVDFKNFKPSGSSNGIAVVNVGANLDLVDVNISNASVGIGTDDVVELLSNIKPSETRLSDVNIENCLIGIMDGIGDGLYADNLVTNFLTLKNTEIKNCKTGIRFVYPSPEANKDPDPYLMFQGGCFISENTVNVDLVDAVSNSYIIKFSGTNSNEENEVPQNWVGFYLEKTLQEGGEPFKIFNTINQKDAFLDNKNYVLKIEQADNNSPTVYIGSVVKLGKDAEGTAKAETPTTISKGSKVSLLVTVPDSITTTSVIALFDSEMEQVEDAVIEMLPQQVNSNTARITFIPKTEGNYRVGYYDSTNKIVTYTNAITISFPSPDPGKKDESCEKVIGPTWHWNNKKGICEDTGVVNTSTR